MKESASVSAGKESFLVSVSLFFFRGFRFVIFVLFVSVRFFLGFVLSCSFLFCIFFRLFGCFSAPGPSKCL